VDADLAAGLLLPLYLPAGGKREVRLNLVCKDSGAVSREVAVLADLLGFNRDLDEV